ncbi:MAG TPA: hypothetical protein ENJ09_04040 [Planctomycetes bacterium]|nr:hypothetical protein [Planctomycetota bacterium]
MRLLNDALTDLVQQGLVDPNEAYLKAVNKDELIQKLAHIGKKVDLGSDGGQSPAAAPAAPAQAASAPGQGLGLGAVPPAQPTPAPQAPLPQNQSPPPPSPAAGGFDDFEQFRKNRG